jgi:uncharacterized protein with PQ loop repeat
VIFIAGVASAALSVFIAYMALSKRVSRPIRIAAVAALVLIGLALALCSVLLFFFLVSPAGAEGKTGENIPLVPAATGRDNIMPIIIFSVVVLAFILVIVFISMREQKRLGNQKKGR